MIPVPWIVVLYEFVVRALAGLAIGALTGFLASRALKLKIRGVMNDCVLGSLGFLLGFIGTLLMPWPRNTITYYVGDTLVTSTMKSYQRSDQVGIVIAIVLTLLRELYRFNRSNGSDNRHAGYGSARLTRKPDI